MMLDREINMPADLMFSSAMPEKDMGVGQYITKLTKSLQEGHHIARENLRESQRRMKRNYDLRILEKPYQEGDRVYVLDNTAIKGKSRKLSAPWKRPGIISEKITPYLFRVQMGTRSWW